MFPDPFKPDLFSSTSLTDAINGVPFLPGRLAELFTERGVATTTVAMEYINGTLRLIQTSPRGSIGQTQVADKRKGITLTVPHIQTNEAVYAESVQNVRMFGSEDQLKPVEHARDEALGMMAANIDFTLEWLRLGAVQGKVYDADGTTLLYNLYTTFGVSEPAEIAFDLTAGSPAAGALKKKCTGVIRSTATALGGLPFTGVNALCGDAFYDDLISHGEAAKTYEIQQNADNILKNSAYDSFFFGGILWENYRGSGSVTIGTDKVRFYPVGVPRLFQTIYAPADYMGAVNTIGLPRYASAEPMKHEKGVELEAQSNPLCVCTRPGVLLRGKRGA